jgi:hypothetical protein
MDNKYTDYEAYFTANGWVVRVWDKEREIWRYVKSWRPNNKQCKGVLVMDYTYAKKFSTMDKAVECIKDLMTHTPKPRMITSVTYSVR